MRTAILRFTPVSLAILAACTTTGPEDIPPLPPLTAIPPEIADSSACSDKTFPVYFASDASSLDKAALTAIDTIIEEAKNCELAAVEVEGHTDSIGSEDINLRVSQQRADAVLKAILDADLDIERVAIIARGEEGAKTAGGLINPMNRKVNVYFRTK